MSKKNLKNPNSHDPSNLSAVAPVQRGKSRKRRSIRVGFEPYLFGKQEFSLVASTGHIWAPGVRLSLGLRAVRATMGLASCIILVVLTTNNDVGVRAVHIFGRFLEDGRSSEGLGGPGREEWLHRQQRRN